MKLLIRQGAVETILGVEVGSRQQNVAAPGTAGTTYSVGRVVRLWLSAEIGRAYFEWFWSSAGEYSVVLCIP